MINNINKIKTILSNTLRISKITGTPRKKIKIAISVFLLNAATFFDIVTILTFANYFQSTETENQLLLFFIERYYLLPVYVLARFSFIYLEKINIKSLQLDIEMNLKNKIMNEIFSKGNYSHSDSFFYVSQLTNHVAYFYAAITAFVNVFIQCLIYLIYLVFNNSNILGLFFAGLILLLPVTKYFSLKSREFTDYVYHENKKIYSDIQKMVENLFIIKIFKLSKSELNAFYEKISNYKKYNFKSFNYSTLIYIVPNFLTLFILSLIFSYSKHSMYLTLEFIGVVIRFFQSVGELNKNFSMLLNSEVHLEKLIELQKNFSEDFSDNFEQIESDKGLKYLKFTNVSFKYIGAEFYVFDDVSFSIYEGDQILVSGENGSGKSTLLGLISGVYFSEKGKVETSFKKIGYVGTESSILNDTLRNNLLYGVKEFVKDETLIEWILKIKLYKSYEEIDLNNQVSSTTLSSGQKQKVSFIRMFLSEIDLLLLDEAFSNLDENSKKDISLLLKNQRITLFNSTHLDENFNYKKKIVIKNKKLIIK